MKTCMMIASEEEWQNLFGTSDDEEDFDGFQRAGAVLALKTAPLRKSQ